MLPHKDSVDLIREVARQAGQSKDKSLFSILLLLDEQACVDAFAKKIEKSGMPIVLDRQPSLIAPPSRYIE